MEFRRFAFATASILLACSGTASARTGTSVDNLGLIPLPVSVAESSASYTLPATASIAASSPDERNVARFLTAFLTTRGVRTSVVAKNAPDATIRLNGGGHDAALGPEGYRLIVDGTGIVISANGGPGLYYGLQTLEQLFAPPPSTAATIREVRIFDRPRYRWRGVMLDVVRHFFPVSFVERYIDLASRYKLNTFHWHLDDDAAWRIQIEKYPRLTSYGSCGDHEHRLGTAPCLFYTQAQIREVVAYAKARYVTVVPEIEMPGHSKAAMLSYPQLACKPVRSDVLCPSAATFAFLDDVLREVIALFPGPYVHTGGDEVVPKAWKASPLAHSVMRANHLADVPALQGWFDRRIERFVEAHGRRMVGWDEILKGGVSRKAVVMVWHGDAGAVAVMRGNDAVMTPDGPLYLDAYQADPAWEPRAIGGLTTLRDVYDYDPAISLLSPQQASHVLGAQANLWTEFVPTQDRAWYRTYPRLMALAELVWTPAKEQKYASFVARTSNQYARFDAAGITYHVPGPIGLANDVVNAASVTVKLRSPVPGASLYYTTDGSYPTTASTPYAAPISLDLAPGQEVRLRVLTVLRTGRRSTPAEATYARRRATHGARPPQRR